VATTSENANTVLELITKGVGEGGVPLIHQVNRRDNNKRTDTGVSDSLDGEEDLTAASWEDDTPMSVVMPPRCQGVLLVVSWFDSDRWREIELRI